jgi:8-oxo-dGTP pyrophosphatase MutT (NUDIX family)
MLPPGFEPGLEGFLGGAEHLLEGPLSLTGLDYGSTEPRRPPHQKRFATSELVFPLRGRDRPRSVPAVRQGLTLSCEDRRVSDPPQSSLIRVTSVVVRWGERALLLRRTVTDPWWPEYWDLPGGMVEPGESYLEAAARELREETGLMRLPLEELGVWERLWTPTPGMDASDHPFSGRRVREVAFRTRVEAEPELAVLASEHSAHAWVSVPEALRYPLTPDRAAVLRAGLGKGPPARRAVSRPVPSVRASGPSRASRRAGSPRGRGSRARGRPARGSRSPAPARGARPPARSRRR